MAAPGEPLVESEAESASSGAPASPSTRAGYAPLLQSGLELAGPSCRRLLPGLGLLLVGSAVLFCSLSGRGAGATPALRVSGVAGLLGAEELQGDEDCAGPGENCISSRCCKDANSHCYAKDLAWAVCKQSCSPGIDDSEAPELQTPWTCAKLRPDSQCSGYGENCTSKACCQDPRFKCYYKDPGWAECRMSCTPGEVHKDEPKAIRKPWSCVPVQGGSAAEARQRLQKLPVASEKAAVTSNSSHCVPQYGNCTEKKCCGDRTSGVAVGCFKRDASWSECRESCPEDDSWACSSKSTTKGPTAASTKSRTVASTTQLVPKAPDTGIAAARSGPSLYCFSLMLPWGGEPKLIRAQLEKGVGIFQCDDWSVLSNESVILSHGPPAVIRTDVLPGSLKCSFGGEYHTALNSEVFYRAWTKVVEIGRFLQYDWTVKADPDAVLLPQRLRKHTLDRNAQASLYINNCFEGLHGPIEVVSLGGMKVFKAGLKSCKQILEREWMTYGEDVWLRRCYGLLGLARVDDYDVLREKACKPFKDPIPCKYNAVSFHPLKTPDKYFKCLLQAQKVDAYGPEA